MEKQDLADPVRFGTFEVDFQSGEVRKAGIRVKLQDQPLQILRILLEKPGRVVTREELQKRIWPADTFVDFDHGVYTAITKLREAMGDSSDNPRFIETLPRRGYRFIAPVEPITGGHGATATSRTGTGPRRLIVLPFYQLRADKETAFLCFSLPDAISHSLAGLESLVVRSSRTAAQFVGPSFDLAMVAAKTEVDTVLTGTLLRAGDQLRVSTQLLTAPVGTLVWAHNAQIALDDIFRLQDELARRIVESLAPTLTEHQRTSIQRDVPVSARAYEFYLRANALSGQMRDLALARDLYRRCLEEDPHFAPAWARLARCYRVLGKYGVCPTENTARSDEAFRRAFALNADLPSAHHFYTHHETESGHAKDAIIRLLGRIRSNRNDPELYAGLIYACRYAGLLGASVAAHKLALGIDPNVSTSISYTHFAMRNFQLAIDTSACETDSCRFEELMALDALGRHQEALLRLRQAEAQDLLPVTRLSVKLLTAFLENDRKRTVQHVEEMNLANPDPESLFYCARFMAGVGETAGALNTLQRAVRGGFYCIPALRNDLYLMSIQTLSGFTEVLREGEILFEQAKDAFATAGGERLLATE